MSPGLWLAVAWLVRAAAWVAIAYGATLAAVAAAFVLAFDVRPPVHPAVPITIGSAVVALGVYAERRARSKIRRLVAARRERAPRG